MTDNKFGARTFAIWYNAHLDFETIDDWSEDCFKEQSDKWVRLSEPFGCIVIERKSAHKEMIDAKVKVIDDDIAEHAAQIDYLKEEKSKLLAISYNPD